MKKLAYTIMTLSFILIISGSVSSFIIGLKKDKLTTFQRMNDVNNTFENFSTNVTIFEEEREGLYAFFNTLYYDTMYQRNEETKEKLSNYEQLVDELSKNVKELKLLCEKGYYPDSLVNTRCENYKNTYEQVVNYFVSDIQFYNDKVSKYNDSQIKSNTLYRIRTYTTDKDYIDFNGDNQLAGGEKY